MDIKSIELNNYIKKAVENNLKIDNMKTQIELINSENEIINSEINKTNQKVINVDNRLIDSENALNYIKNSELNINFFNGTTIEEKLINMIKFATSNKHKKVSVPSGIYNFANILSDTIELGEEFKKIKIIGENPKDTVFQYTHLLDKPFIKVKGGSGSMSMGSIENIRFEGNNTTKAIQLADVCGFKVKNCSFGTNKVGINFYNENGFTEYCIAEDCDFDSVCISTLEYNVRDDNGHVSFHGSGIKNSTINQNPSSLTSNIIIGPRALVYNSPLDFTIWTTTPVPIIQHDGDKLSNVFGNIRIETFGNDYHQLVNGTELYFIGGVEDWGGYTKFDNVLFMESVAVFNGGISGVMKPNSRSKRLIQGDNILMNCGSDYQIQLTAIGAFYRYCGNFIIGKNPQADEIEITKLNEHSLFDQLNKGHILLKASGNNLIINVPNEIDSLNVTYTYRNLN